MSRRAMGHENAVLFGAARMLVVRRVQMALVLIVRAHAENIVIPTENQNKVKMKKRLKQ